MAAAEEQVETLVAELVGSGTTGAPARLDRRALAVDADALAPDHVDRAVVGRADDPRTRLVGDAVARPSDERGREGVLHRLLGQVEVAERADEDADRAAEPRAVDLGDPVGDLVAAHGSRGGSGIRGRTSIEPNRALGMRAAASSASCSVSQSTR